MAHIELHVLQLRANEEGHRRQLAEAVKAGEAAATLTESGQKDLEAAHTKLKEKNAELETSAAAAAQAAQKLLDLEQALKDMEEKQAEDLRKLLPPQN